ncbi:hypothetical protein [Ectobacillus ponti]|uniref:Uncharacterized protein n=1 Tax=Ectobacillus ponti TaxID=2961894 RepID=A0AA41XF41_9BACI|nr:hypothetical protein [Ectobacillus ponti]MCP8970951.1 hypothetical protein [Ectobacillus ponti]
MKNFMDRIKQFAADAIEAGGIPIPVTADMLLMLFRAGTKQEKANEIHNLDVTFREDTVSISGFTRKMLMEIQFELQLKPVKAKDRTLYFEVVKMKPLNQNWIKNLVLNHPPVTVYEHGLLEVDLNHFETIRKIKVGNIQGFEVREQKIWITVGR